MHLRRSQRSIAALIAATLLFAACGDDDDGDAAAAEDVTEETTATEEETAAEETTTTTTTTAAPDPAEVETEVTTAIESFFQTLGEGRFEETATYLVNGEAHLSEFQSFGNLATGVTADVKSVELLDDETALYTMDIAINGEVALPDSSGEAVLVDGVWLMSEDSWNALAALAPPE